MMTVDGKPLNSLGAVMDAAVVLTAAAGLTVTIARGDERFDMRVVVR